MILICEQFSCSRSYSTAWIIDIELSLQSFNLTRFDSKIIQIQLNLPIYIQYLYLINSARKNVSIRFEKSSKQVKSLQKNSPGSKPNPTLCEKQARLGAAREHARVATQERLGMCRRAANQAQAVHAFQPLLHRGVWCSMRRGGSWEAEKGLCIFLHGRQFFITAYTFFA